MDDLDQRTLLGLESAVHPRVPRQPFSIAQGPLVLLGLLLLVPYSVEARVFYRWKAGHQSTKVLLDAGARLAYEAEVTLNSGEGHLAVLSFDKSFEETLVVLRHVFGTAVFSHSGDNMAVGTFLDDRVGIRMLVISPGDAVRTLVLKLEQSPNEFLASARAPAKHLLVSVPEYPGGIPVFSATDHNTATSVAVTRVFGGTDSVRQTYEMQLLREGWKHALAGADEGDALRAALVRGQSVSVYLRGNELCCLLVQSARATGESYITVLHKKGVK
ncbi:MAG: hypothetical protein N2255_04060 [Kiritimatiellae bacterium]|nr:hypothetical protein [Kiritimatiellia bacterium]